MLKIWDPTNFRRTLGGLCLILAPIFFAIAEITYPASEGNTTDSVRSKRVRQRRAPDRSPVERDARKPTGKWESPGSRNAA